jgi:Clp amino terminal domain, pathogenicity island component
MGYRGEDLDLRTPQTWTAAAADALGGPAAETQRVRPMLQQGVGRTGPIWVDDVVLACSNHAFDVALAHRSSEVRLEHLLHALTRIDLAADVLEAYGLRVGQLRRDSATVIASEIPVGLSNGRAAPRRSDELEDVLRMAAGLSARRNAPASVEDLLQVMLEAMPDLPGLQLIQRNLGPKPINTYAEVMPPMVRNPYSYDPMDQSRERMRASYAPSDPMMRPSARSDFNAAPVDSVQNTRLDALEQMVRTLGLDLQNERKMVATVLQDVQREIGAQRDDTSRLSGGLHDRLQTSLGERLQGLENAVINMRPGSPADLAPLFDRVAAMERSLQSVLLANQRTSELLTEKIATLSTRAGGVDLTPIINRLDIIEEAVLSRDGDPHSSLSERLDVLDEQLTAERRRSSEAQSALLAEIKTAAGGVSDTLKGQMERQRGEIAVAILTPLTDRVNGLSAAIEGRDQDVSRDFSTVKERLIGVEKSLGTSVQKSNELSQAAAEAQKTHTLELGEVHEALMKLNANQHTLAGSVEQWRRDGATALGGLGDHMLGLTTNIDGFGSRLEGLEKEAGRPMQMLEAMSGTMDNMHRVTVERYYRRNRFWYWLFGTDDWVASSWPSHAQRIAEDLKSVKAAVRARA